MLTNTIRYFTAKTAESAKLRYGIHGVWITDKLKAHLHGIPEVVSVLRNEAIAYVSGMQSSRKGHNNIIACNNSYSKHKLNDDFASCK